MVEFKYWGKINDTQVHTCSRCGSLVPDEETWWHSVYHHGGDTDEEDVEVEFLEDDHDWGILNWKVAVTAASDHGPVFDLQITCDGCGYVFDAELAEDEMAKAVARFMRVGRKVVASDG